MIALGTDFALVAAHPYAVLFPLAVVEGPIVTVVAASLMASSPLALGGVFATCVLADVVGDTALYALGRRAHAVPARWQARLGLTENRLARLRNHFRHHGPVTIVIAKATQAACLPVLAAAGAARMPVARFLFWSLVSTLPKVAALMALGVAFGSALGAISSWIGRASLIATAALIVGAGLWAQYRRRTSECP